MAARAKAERAAVSLLATCLPSPASRIRRVPTRPGPPPASKTTSFPPGAVAAYAAAPGTQYPVTPYPVTPGATPPYVYPARLHGYLDPNLSRWMWLVKWFLAIPHCIILFFLWFAFGVVTIVAWFAILFTARYPRSLFNFNAGVIRWNWRVAFYAFSAIGTDVYPPFTLARTEYPADFDVDYPERLSRGLVLVKSWLLAIPHLLIIGVLTGTATTWVFRDGEWEQRSVGISLLGLLVLIAGVILLFTGQYWRGIFDLLLGLNRWIYRVIAYVALMRDEYPPFHLDMGPVDPAKCRLPPEGRPPDLQPDLPVRRARSRTGARAGSGGWKSRDDAAAAPCAVLHRSSPRYRSPVTGADSGRAALRQPGEKCAPAGSGSRRRRAQRPDLHDHPVKPIPGRRGGVAFKEAFGSTFCRIRSLMGSTPARVSASPRARRLRLVRPATAGIVRPVPTRTAVTISMTPMAAWEGTGTALSAGTGAKSSPIVNLTITSRPITEPMPTMVNPTLKDRRILGM